VCASSNIWQIGDYGVIGDCRSAALISRHGSIDWLCWPRLDSPSILAAILDRTRGGRWSICTEEPFQAERAYIRDSNVLQTHFSSSSGRATLTDLMPVDSEAFKCGSLLPDHQLIRDLRCTSGKFHFSMEFHPRADYGSKPVSIRHLGELGLRMEVGRGAYWLRSNCRISIEGNRALASLTLKAGDTARFALTYAEESPSVLPALGEAIPEVIQRSVDWWQRWAARMRYEGPYRDAVARSALVLKLLEYAPSGAIAAAVSTSLPERVGDALNWDYRYCWLRDASLSIRALLGLGFIDEAQAFLTWLLHTTNLTRPELQVLYTVFGKTAPNERELADLEGFAGSRPVRIGNGARRQLQLDVYGEVVEAAAQYAHHVPYFDVTTQKTLIGFGNYVARNWDQPDEGIWEPRSGRLNHTHSRLMCWTALDRILALSEKGLLHGAPRDSFVRERNRIRKQIETRAWNEAMQSYVSVLDGATLDATLLRLAWYGFEHANSHRMQCTYRRICEALGAGDNLLYRYKRQPPEGAFGVCGFWGVEQLALGGGTLAQAHDAFQRLLEYQTDLGLFAEEVDPSSGEALGNIPQAFTHVGLISAALTLAERERGTAHPALHIGADVKPSRSKGNA